MYITGASPNGSAAVLFGENSLSTQLGFVPGVAANIPGGNTNGYTCYMYFNDLVVDTIGNAGQTVLDLTTGNGFRMDTPFNGFDVTALEYSPGSFGFTHPRTGWDMWTFVCNPPFNFGSPTFGNGDIQIYRNDIQVGPTSNTYGPIVVTSWNMTLQNAIYVSGNPVGNLPFKGYIGIIALFSGAHNIVTRIGVEKFFRRMLG